MRVTGIQAGTGRSIGSHGPHPDVGSSAAGVTPPPRVATEILTLSRVQKRFATLKERFIPSKAKGVNGVLQFNITGKGGGTWYVVLKDGKITVGEGKYVGKADVTIEANAENYEKVASDEMSGTWAVLTRKMKVDGNRDLAKKFKEFFHEFKG